MSVPKVVTISSLIKKDLEDAYFLPLWPSSFSKGYKFLNKDKYQVYDCHVPSLTFSQQLFPFRILPAAGDDVFLLLEHQPPTYLTDHWKKWLPNFPLAKLKTVDDGLKDDVKIVTYGALEAISREKHSVDPDVLYRVQLKSEISKIGVPFPARMEENSVEFPCVVKVDQSWSGQGVFVARNKDELSSVLNEIRGKHGWRGQVLFEKVIGGIKEVPSFLFHLHKSGEIYWIGTTCGEFNGFEWISGWMDWTKQEHYKRLVWDDFTLPIKEYLRKQGFFGLVSFEVIIADSGMYLCDLNPRVAGETTHVILASHLAKSMRFHKSWIRLDIHFDCSANTLVQEANEVNRSGRGVIVVLSAVDTIHGSVCELSIFGNTFKDVNDLYNEMESKCLDG